MKRYFHSHKSLFQRAILSLFCALCVLLPATTRAQEAPPPPKQDVGAVVVGDRVVFTIRESVGSISALERAGIVNGRLKRVLTEAELRPELMKVTVGTNGNPLIGLPGLPILDVTQGDAQGENVTQQVLAENWSNLLRATLSEAKPLYHEDEGGHHGISFMPLLIVSALAFVVPLVVGHFKRFPVPVVVGEILCGIVIGRSGFNLVRYDSWLQFLAEFGFSYLMFLSGLEVDVSLLTKSKNPEALQKGNVVKSAADAIKNVLDTNGNSSKAKASKANEEVVASQNDLSDAKKSKPDALKLALLVFVLMFALGMVASLILMQMGMIKQPWLMALILSTTSLGLVVPVLKESHIGEELFGKSVLLTAIISDFVAMLLITVIVGWISQGLTVQLFLGMGVLIAFAIAFSAGQMLSRMGRPGEILRELSKATSQVSVRGSMFLMLAFVALSATLGTEVILGAFLAGVLLSIFTGSHTSDLRHKLEALGFGFFIPIFFVMVGVRFDLSALTSSQQGLILAPMLILAVIAINLLAVLPFLRIASWRQTLAGGFLLASRLSLVIAAAEIGQRLGLFDEAVYAALIAVALVTSIVGPMGFQLLMPAKNEATEDTQNYERARVEAL